MHDKLIELYERRDPPAIALTGLMVIAFALPCVLAMCHDLIVGADDLVGAVMAGSFFSVVTLIGFALIGLAYHFHRDAAKLTKQDRERQVLQVARDHHGHLTVPELALDSDLTLTESAELLTHMEQLDLATVGVSEGGQVVYLFPAFATPRDKLTAHDVVSEMVQLQEFDDKLNDGTNQETEPVAEPVEVGLFNFWKRW